jgi:hypothetical protein
MKKSLSFLIIFILLIACNSNTSKNSKQEDSSKKIEQKTIGDFLIYDLKVDTLQLAKRDAKNHSLEDQKYLNNSIFYTISGKIKNTSDKTFIKARFEGQLQMKFDKKDLMERIDLFSSTINGEEIIDWDAFNISRGWKPNESYTFTFITFGIDEIYSNYNPNTVNFLLQLNAEDPVGYVFKDIVYSKDLKDQWTFKK